MSTKKFDSNLDFEFRTSSDNWYFVHHELALQPNTAYSGFWFESYLVILIMLKNSTPWLMRIRFMQISL